MSSLFSLILGPTIAIVQGKICGGERDTVYFRYKKKQRLPTVSPTENRHILAYFEIGT
jgi:hypothetical protein